MYKIEILVKGSRENAEFLLSEILSLSEDIFDASNATVIAGVVYEEKEGENDKEKS